MCRAVKRHSIHCTGRKSQPISLVDVAVAVLQVASTFCLCLNTILMLLPSTDMNIMHAPPPPPPMWKCYTRSRMTEPMMTYLAYLYYNSIEGGGQTQGILRFAWELQK